MNKQIFAAGLVVLIVGIFLAVAFWPIFGVQPSGLADDRDGPDYESYDEGDEVLVYGTITDIGEPPEHLEGLGTHVEIDDELHLILDEDRSLDFEEGDEVYGTLKLKKTDLVIMEYEYWELDGDFHSKNMVDYLFYGITGAGIVIVAVGAIKI